MQQEILILDFLGFLYCLFL